ncbi:unnamed protein product [Thelazia callipaeda]|uniref:Ovule protein n=1 Tax=Thelazia callipaeda TaxID=103827 RepID=A0A0N5CXG1_THECL|nr:unnamed protein product [Thelazia callipaeda]
MSDSSLTDQRRHMDETAMRMTSSSEIYQGTDDYKDLSKELFKAKSHHNIKSASTERFLIDSYGDHNWRSSESSLISKKDQCAHTVAEVPPAVQAQTAVLAQAERRSDQKKQLIPLKLEKDATSIGYKTDCGLSHLYRRCKNVVLKKRHKKF